MEKIIVETFKGSNENHFTMRSGRVSSEVTYSFSPVYTWKGIRIGKALNRGFRPGQLVDISTDIKG